MPKKLAVELQFNIETVRQAVYFITKKLLTDKEINKRFFDRETIIVDVVEKTNEQEAMQMAFVFVALIIEQEEKEKTTDESL